jgi:biotin synthase
MEQFTTRLMQGNVRHDFELDEIGMIYHLPITRLLNIAQTVHARSWPDDEVQLCTLLSIKTGGCKENCSYCPQSAHHSSKVDAHGLLKIEEIRKSAQAAKDAGSTRFCMGAAWREAPKTDKVFNQIINTVKEVKGMGLEVCMTLGMLTEDQAVALKEAGVYAYNHNIDSSREFYEKIISTRTFDDRLNTLKNVRKAGMTVCCGGIVGMGEEVEDRLKFLRELNAMDPHPESVPINLLIKVEGTPLEDEEDLDIFDMIRTIATARILMPKSRVRLSAGRKNMSDEAQAMAFTAGANSIFTGDKLLTTENPDFVADKALLNRLGMKAVMASE